jgi:hypothetical protein
MLKTSLQLRAGEHVQVRTKEEILSTLDEKGQLEELPFMPEMLRYCGKTFRVSKRAHKTCDPAIGIQGRKMPATVHLEDLRCDGSAHDGCQARCLIFWKDAWLKRVDPKATAESRPVTARDVDTSLLERAEHSMRSGVKIPAAHGGSEPTYVCQNTQIKFATQPQSWWDLRQYVEDYTSGNVPLSRLAAGLIYTVWRTGTEAGIGISSAMRWIYNQFQRATGGSPYPLGQHGVPKGTKTPKVLLDLQEGETIRVKPLQEILNTLDCNYRNRGLYFDAEMVPFTEREYEVDYRVRRIIDERTGKMIEFGSDALVLKDVKCEARYAVCRRFCPRAIYPYWREIWLDRASDKHGEQ